MTNLESIYGKCKEEIYLYLEKSWLAKDTIVQASSFIIQLFHPVVDWELEYIHNKVYPVLKSHLQKYFEENELPYLESLAEHYIDNKLPFKNELIEQIVNDQIKQIIDGLYHEPIQN